MRNLWVSRARALYIGQNESATSATGRYNTLKYSILRVHFGFLKMLLEKLLAGVSSHLHIWELLCRYETYRKVRSDFSICLIGNFSCGADFSKNSVDFFKNGGAVLKNLVDFLENLASFL